MKTKVFIFLICIFVAVETNAQSEPSDYEKRVLEALENGNCASAQFYYNIYKDLFEKVNSSLQSLIDNCQNEKSKIYNICDIISVDGKDYTVAYVSDDGKHGIAAQVIGWKYPYDIDEINKYEIPTIDELKLIYSRRGFLLYCDGFFQLSDLSNVYLSCTRSSVYKSRVSITIRTTNGSYTSASEPEPLFYAMNFSTGEVLEQNWSDKCVILNIYRF